MVDVSDFDVGDVFFMKLNMTVASTHSSYCFFDESHLYVSEVICCFYAMISTQPPLFLYTVAQAQVWLAFGHTAHHQCFVLTLVQRTVNTFSCCTVLSG
mmetsp:Transcript_79750/g.140699  ORF Transcript_79750/g.140699 Transcript_79750/m.140699 type:complete len:99 (-) Transcript_79750:261-557(-)